MTLLASVRNFFAPIGGEYGYDDQQPMVDYSSVDQPREGRVVQVAPQAKPQKLTIYSPKSFEDAQHPAIDIKAGTTTIVNFHRLNAHEADRISFFLQGVVFALNGEFTQVADKTLVFAPNHMGLVNRGDLTAQAAQAQYTSFPNNNASPLHNVLR